VLLVTELLAKGINEDYSHFNVCLYGFQSSHFFNVLFYDKKNIKKVKVKNIKKVPSCPSYERTIRGKQGKMGILCNKNVESNLAIYVYTNTHTALQMFVSLKFQKNFLNNPKFEKIFITNGVLFIIKLLIIVFKKEDF
jgi:hypothetical protein